MPPDIPIQTAICSGNVHPDESTGDQDGDDESERQVPHVCVPRRLRRTRRYSYHVSHSATGRAQPATRPHPGSPQLFLPHSPFLPRTRGPTTEISIPRDTDEPLWLRRRCRFEPLTIAPTSRTANTQSGKCGIFNRSPIPFIFSVSPGQSHSCVFADMMHQTALFLPTSDAALLICTLSCHLTFHNFTKIGLNPLTT
ncbi:hypothetical protein P879_03033 [Paragonimus westermani]|uniref:Uncharacterized protein n=1 Tax=Paragonimus westermani TaxID=34504 RepID=A0A8T0DWG1_9TREM|nr:hypothetical protein P879_03033 [Paragonimus westermani]